jgi:type 1 fimbriae regulatory protein FimB
MDTGDDHVLFTTLAYGEPSLESDSPRGPLTRSTVNKLVTRAGHQAEMEFPVHPHMLRHACGYYLANKGVDTRTIQDYLGHISIVHTVRYTELSPNKFKGLWS